MITKQHTLLVNSELPDTHLIRSLTTNPCRTLFLLLTSRYSYHHHNLRIFPSIHPEKYFIELSVSLCHRSSIGVNRSSYNNIRNIRQECYNPLGRNVTTQEVYICRHANGRHYCTSVCTDVAVSFMFLSEEDVLTLFFLTVSLETVSNNLTRRVQYLFVTSRQHDFFIEEEAFQRQEDHVATLEK